MKLIANLLRMAEVYNVYTVHDAAWKSINGDIYETIRRFLWEGLKLFPNSKSQIKYCKMEHTNE